MAFDEACEKIPLPAADFDNRQWFILWRARENRVDPCIEMRPELGRMGLRIIIIRPIHNRRGIKGRIPCEAAAIASLEIHRDAWRCARRLRAIE
jgi:hypothetical protein